MDGMRDTLDLTPMESYPGSFLTPVPPARSRFPWLQIKIFRMIASVFRASPSAAEEFTNAGGIDVLLGIMKVTLLEIVIVENPNIHLMCTDSHFVLLFFFLF